MATEPTGKSTSGAHPDFPKSLHFVGIGGIGMSGLAQMFRDLGCTVTGSDRALGHPENERIFAALRKCGAKLYPQDGSVYAGGYAPDAIVYSTAIEEDNPDFKCAPEGDFSVESDAITDTLDQLMFSVHKTIASSAGKINLRA